MLSMWHRLRTVRMLMFHRENILPKKLEVKEKKADTITPQAFGNFTPGQTMRSLVFFDRIECSFLHIGEPKWRETYNGIDESNTWCIWFLRCLS